MLRGRSASTRSATGNRAQTGVRTSRAAGVLLRVNTELTSARTAIHSRIAPSILNKLRVELSKLNCRSCACRTKVRHMCVPQPAVAA